MKMLSTLSERWDTMRQVAGNRVAKSKRQQITDLQADLRRLIVRVTVMEAEVAVEMALRAIDDHKGRQEPA
jgi:hypothetical protein